MNLLHDLSFFIFLRETSNFTKEIFQRLDNSIFLQNQEILRLKLSKIKDFLG